VRMANGYRAAGTPGGSQAPVRAATAGTAATGAPVSAATASGAPTRSASAAKKKRKKKRRSTDAGAGAILLLRDIIIAFVVIIVVLQFIKPTIVFETSMENTLHPQDYVFLAKQAYRFGEVEAGDIIVFQSTLDDDMGGKKSLIKRVIAVPGDTLEIKDGYVYRNGEQLYEPYTKDGTTQGDLDPIIVPEGMYFAMGDNRLHSKDSRDPEVGYVPFENIKGKVVFRLFPISDIGAVE